MTVPAVSFEFFPPRSIEASFRLQDTVRALSTLDPRFVSVTYGAGGTTRQLTREAVVALRRSTDLDVAAHLTCVDASREETLDLASQMADAGVREIVALRGDPPAGEAGFRPHSQGFASSVELIAALAETGRFSDIRVGAYPDVHPDAADSAANIDWLKRKIDAGATEALTQFFFEPETFLRFRDACASAGIDAPITPGILPVENWASAQRFATRCGAQIPDPVASLFERAERDDRTDLLAVAFASELCGDLIEEGVEALHFYTLNRPELTRDICLALGVQPRVALRDVA